MGRPDSKLTGAETATTATGRYEPLSNWHLDRAAFQPMVRRHNPPYSEQIQAVRARLGHQIGVAPNRAPISPASNLACLEKLSVTVTELVAIRFEIPLKLSIVTQCHRLLCAACCASNMNVGQRAGRGSLRRYAGRRSIASVTGLGASPRHSCAFPVHVAGGAENAACFRAFAGCNCLAAICHAGVS